MLHCISRVPLPYTKQLLTQLVTTRASPAKNLTDCSMPQCQPLSKISRKLTHNSCNRQTNKQTEAKTWPSNINNNVNNNQPESELAAGNSGISIIKAMTAYSAPNSTMIDLQPTLVSYLAAFQSQRSVVVRYRPTQVKQSAASLNIIITKQQNSQTPHPQQSEEWLILSHTDCIHIGFNVPFNVL